MAGNRVGPAVEQQHDSRRRREVVVEFSSTRARGASRAMRRRMAPPTAPHIL